MPHCFRLFLAAALLVGLTACQSFQSRAREKAAVFATLDGATKARLEAREIHVGDTPDMVYIALGKPTEKQNTVTASGSSEVWTYSIFWQDYQGTRLVGYRREVAYNAATKTYHVAYVPDYQPIYTPRVEDRLRVTFTGGRVSVVEQAAAQSIPPGSAVK